MLCAAWWVSKCVGAQFNEVKRAQTLKCLGVYIKYIIFICTRIISIIALTTSLPLPALFVPAAAGALPI